MAYETGIEGVDDATRIYRGKLYSKGERLSGPTGPMHLENTVGGEQEDPNMNPEEAVIDVEETAGRGFDADKFIDRAFENYPDGETPERSETAEDTTGEDE